MVSGSISPPYSGYFSPFPHGTGSLSVSQEYLALPDGAGGFPQDFSGPAVLRIPLCCHSLPVRGYHPYRAVSHLLPVHSDNAISWSYNPQPAVTGWVWALSRSLATTWEIIVIFFSYAYLDVSVQRVRVLYDYSSNSQVAPFGNLRIKSHLPIPVAYRSLSRPSSPLRA